MELLPTIWFIAIAVLWTGYLFLEGFDLGVGMLMKVFARNNTERRVLINTIGPVWDGNEVWLLTAGGATFAAFPLWYASLFSALYLPLLLVLVALIFRAVAFEYRGKVDNPRWRARWDWAISAGSLRRGLRRRRRAGPDHHGTAAERQRRPRGRPVRLVQRLRRARRPRRRRVLPPARARGSWR